MSSFSSSSKRLRSPPPIDPCALPANSALSHSPTPFYSLPLPHSLSVSAVLLTTSARTEGRRLGSKGHCLRQTHHSRPSRARSSSSSCHRRRRCFNRRRLFRVTAVSGRKEGEGGRDLPSRLLLSHARYITAQRGERPIPEQPTEFSFTQRSRPFTK